MSELAKIKNKIQEAAGQNVNIIEGVGIDTDLGMAISVTVIATGFEERRKPKGTTTVKLDSDNLDEIVSDELNGEDITDNFNNTQQTLLLEDEIESVNDFNENTKDIIDEFSELDSTSNNVNNKIVLNLGNQIDDLSSVEKEKIVSEKHSSFKSDDELTSSQKTIELDSEKNINLEQNLNPEITPQVNSEVMKIECREREERLRHISMQLRTPSGLTSLEDVPAYKRNNIDISEPIHSSESEASSFTLTNTNTNTEIKKNNSFLHDNVD
jgi:cell division protein FtsZ